MIATIIFTLALGLIIGHFFANQINFYRGYNDGYNDAKNDSETTKTK